MANKLDTTRPLFLGPVAARAGTVVDHIRKAVAALDTGSGVLYPQLEEYLLKNYTPAKSANYNGSFVKSYVRDAVNKYEYLSYADGGHEYKAETAPQAKPKQARAPRVSKAQQEVLQVLGFIHTAGEVEGPDDVGNTVITIEDVAQELNKRRNWVEGRVATAVEQGLATLEEENGKKLVYLTANGYNAVAPQATDSSETSEQTAEEEETA